MFVWVNIACIRSRVFAMATVVLLTKYYSGDQIEKNVIGRALSMYGERRGLHMFLVGKPEGRRPLGRPRRRWEDNIKMEVGWGNGLE
jgi:hypothetical protein